MKTSCQPTGRILSIAASTGSSYKWFNGTTQVGTNATYTATIAGAYTVAITNASGCAATSTSTQITSTASITWYADVDNDGVGDIANTVNACTQPTGYVSIAGDACPIDANKTVAGNCGCGNTETSCLDCAGVPNGTAFLDNCSICVGGTTGTTGCLSTGTLNQSSTTNALSIYPQPFTTSTTISLKNKIIKTVTILNIQGISIEYGKDIDCSEIQIGESLSSGLYFVIIESETEAYTIKIIKY